METLQDVLDYISTLASTQSYFEVTHGSISKDASVDDLIFVRNSTVFLTQTNLRSVSTSQTSPLRLLHWFMRYKDDDPKWGFYLLERNIDFSNIWDMGRLDPFLQLIKDDTYNLSDSRFQTLEEDFAHSALTNESDKAFLIRSILTASTLGIEDALVRNEYNITYLTHTVKSDLVILLNSGSCPVLFLAEDKFQNFQAAAVKNFDQMSTFALARSAPVVFGVVTDLDTWRFTTYVSPGAHKDISEVNLLMSSPVRLTIGVLPKRKIVREEIQNLCRIISGFIRNDIETHFKGFILGLPKVHFLYPLCHLFPEN